MENCPPEIQMLVFSFACTDDGSTGRSLSLVSRTFRELSYPYQWQSLAIHGRTQATAFAKVMCSRTFTMTIGFPGRPIYHLLICSRPPPSAPDRRFLSLENPYTWTGVLRTILRLAAPTLRTLAMICFQAPIDCAIVLSPVLHIHYPVLTELTIRARCTVQQLSQPPSTSVEHEEDVADDATLLADDATLLPDDATLPADDANSLADDATLLADDATVLGDDATVLADDATLLADNAIHATTWPSIPSLRRLHLACNFQGLARGTHAEHKLISELAPSLTHLRLSALDLWGSKRMAEIVHAECAESGVVDSVIEVPPTPPTDTDSPTSTSTRRRFAVHSPSSSGSSHPRAAHLGHSPFGTREPIVHRATRVTWDRVIPQGALELFVLQPPPTENANFYCTCCMDYRGDGDVMRVFEALDRASDERFLYIPCRTKLPYDLEDAMADWLERIDGLPGCWGRGRQDTQLSGARDAAGSSIDGEQGPDRGTTRARRTHSVTFRSAVKQLQKAKFW